jgi:GT2 family glycosyltransferase
MKLSIIIVNYNVKHFLEQCLISVFNAINSIDAEVIIVDNNSVDGSVQMIEDKFPDVVLIANNDNRGFSKANNQGIKISHGEYVLLLNPDTIVEEDTFEKCISFMDEHPDGGGLGVKMLDGKGRFLPESKRGLPTPSAAFFKMFGLSKIFPKSKRFSAYHQGHLDENETHSIEILSGAFMFMRKEALDKVGLLDEDFFMYGEDIDLSYRIIQGGYKNYYFPETRIIHYKGESTKKNSVNYVYVFYNAMVIFAKKHYSSENAKIFSFLINSAIVFRAMISLVASTFRKLLIPVIDFAVVYSGMLFSATLWAKHIFGESQTYPLVFINYFIPAIIIFWLIVIYYAGGYDKPIKPVKLLLGQVIGSLLILVIYALMPESYRFSRMIILFGALWSFVSMLAWRFIFYKLGFKGLKMGSKVDKRIAIVGDYKESSRVLELIDQTSINASFKAIVHTEENPQSTSNIEVLGNINQLDEIVKIHKINELIFCAKSFQSAKIIDLMTSLKSPQLEFKIAPPEQMFIIGSSSINTSSDIYFVELNAINKESNRRFKRLFDFSISIVLLTLYPFHFFIFKSPIKYLTNLVKVLFASKTFVGFDDLNDNLHLPIMRKSILHPSHLLSNSQDINDISRLNLVYARDYKISNDFNILWKAFRNLDNN